MKMKTNGAINIYINPKDRIESTKIEKNDELEEALKETKEIEKEYKEGKERDTRMLTK